MSKICTMFSGSSGNCTYISSGEDSVLVDAGVSCKQILFAIENNYIDIKTIKGIFITHTHEDHIKGLRVLLKKVDIPVFASKESLGTLLMHETFSPQSSYYDLSDASESGININVDYFKTSHDSEGSVGYCFTFENGEKISLCTDLGIVTDNIREKLSGSKAVVIESNHDVGMLQNCSYPFETKQRILSDCGHLSNAACAVELPALVKSGTTHIILAHLSRENNTPDIARVTAESVLMENGMINGKDYSLYVAPPSGGKTVFF